MRKKDTYLTDNTAKLNKKDYIIMGIMVLIYALISFYRLGNMTSPKTVYTFSDVNEEVVIQLNEKIAVSRIRYWTGVKTGDFKLMISTDNKHYTESKDFSTYSVLAWEDTDIYADVSSIKIISMSPDAELGDIAFYDYQNARIALAIDKSNPMLDETNLVPSYKSFMNSTYFDEIYHARSAYEYANGMDAFEWSHPPLGKLIMTIPVLLFGYSPFSVRLMGNLAGIMLIPIMYILCKKIFKNRKYAILGALLMMFDNMHFVHTRIALVDGFEVLFILLSVLFMKNYIDLKKDDSFKKKRNNLLLSGLFIGCAIATKWNAAYVALGLAIVFFIHLAHEYNFTLKKYFNNKNNVTNLFRYLFGYLLIPLSLYYLSTLCLGKTFPKILLSIYLIFAGSMILFSIIDIFRKDRYLLKLFIVCVISFILIPLIVYVLSYILFPNIDYYDKTLLGIIDQTKLMYDYHSGLDATHPFSSTWYEWPIMYRPVWLYSGQVINSTRETIVDIGNPAIWWFGIVGFVYLVVSAIKKNKESLFILVFVLSSYIPYIFIGRIMFLYHYFITLPFIMLGITAFIKWLTEKYKTDKIYWLYIILVIIIFFVFYPVTSGMRVGEDYINSIKWLSSWVF